MKKILIFSHEFPPFGGGAGIVAYQYCLKFKNKGYEVTLLTREQARFSEKLNGINIIGVKHIPKLWFLPYKSILKELDLTKFDTIILNDIASGYIAGKYFDDEILKKSIPILHGSEPENIYNNISFWFKIINFPKYYTNMLNKCKRIVSVSKYMKEKFLEKTAFKDEKKIEVVYAGLDEEFLKFQDKEVNCKSIYKHQNKEIILSVSRIEKNKGFFDMYQIFKKLIKIDKNFIWVIIGDGSYKDELKSLVKKDNLEKFIIFKGKVDRDELYKYYKCADVFWLLSKYKESFGLVYLEAQAYSCPAIGYNRYGVKEAIEDNKTGFLVDNSKDCLDIFLSKSYKSINEESIKNFIKSFQQAIGSIEDD